MIKTCTISKIERALSYIHATLMLMMVTPLLYGIGEVELEESEVVIALKCLAVILPVIVTKRVQRLSKNLGTYIFVCLGTLAVLYSVTYFPFKPLSAYAACYMFTIVSETFFLAVFRLADRLKKVDFGEENIPSVFDRPRVGYVWYFAIVYLIGIIFNSKLVCDMSFWSAILYMVVAFWYEYLVETKSYLRLNSRTKGIPKKRLYAVSAMMALIFLMICLVGILPSVFMSGYRRYTDIRHWFDNKALEEITYGIDGGYMPQNTEKDLMLQFLPNDGTDGREPVLLSAILWAVVTVCLLAGIYGMFKSIRRIFRDFRNALDENGDIIEEIEEETAGYSEEEFFADGKKNDSEVMRIRRKYKKTIKRHMKTSPAPCDTPEEIEKNAGLGDNPEMKKLHKEYEHARYGEVN